jgi:hypothetical protein
MDRLVETVRLATVLRPFYPNHNCPRARRAFHASPHYSFTPTSSSLNDGSASCNYAAAALQTRLDPAMNLKREYKGIEIHAQAPLGASGYVPEVTLVRLGAAVSERKFYPPVRNGFEIEGEALACAMQYGFDLIDGDVEGFNPAHEDVPPDSSGRNAEEEIKLPDLRSRRARL